ncbi:MAG TPA: TOBE-like domain-containing protein [Pirellulales bacterium]|jgi:sulfate transport system ATP-binding protein|nr:TOBE-like domain-containing protein [Pirellulales bacterium]
MGIEVRRVTKTFGVYKALDDVNLTIESGELVSLLGPSGSGKTTLLRIIAGLEVPDDRRHSQILFDGVDVARQAIGQRRVGFVFQHYALFRHLTVFENVAFGLRVRPSATRPRPALINDKVRELLRLIQLEGFSNRYPAQLSGGQRQRVALARALAIEPQVLLLDEPFGALDAKVRQGLRAWLRRLHEELRMTSVLVTHDQEEALEVSDRVVIMNHSKVEQVGTPEDIFHQPKSEFVMDFLGQVNVFHARVEHGRAVLDNVRFDVPELAGSAMDQATLYARPHELEIERARNGAPAIAARVLRINPAGAVAKVALRRAAGGELQVDLPFERFQELALRTGEEVFVALRRVRVFAPEYVI